jgi:hypothetical protein
MNTKTDVTISQKRPKEGGLGKGQKDHYRENKGKTKEERKRTQS